MPGRRATGQGRAEAYKRREDYWRGIVGRQRRSGLTHSDFCRSESISANSYFWWKRELRNRDEKRRRTSARGAKSRARENDTSSLVEVMVTTPWPSANTPVFEVVLSNHRVVRVPAEFDAESLKRLLSVLEETAC